MYSVTGISSEGCAGTASVVVLVNQPPVITITGETEVCRPNSTTLVAQGGVSYIWNNGAPSDVITVSAPGVYQVMGFDADGCYSTASVTVNFWDTNASEVTLSVPDSCYNWNGEWYCQSGDYVQTLQNIHGCDSVVTLHLTIEVSINSFADGSSIKVYPNPTSNIVTIEVESDPAELNSVVLYNSTGMQVQRMLWETGQNRMQMDLSDLSPGLYLIKLYSRNGYVRYVKVVKQ